MSSSDIEQAVLRLLTNEVEDYDQSSSLTTLFEKLTEPRRRRNVLFDEVDPNDDDKEALRVVLDQMVLDGLIEATMGERDYERSYRITDQGAYEDVFEDPVYVPELKVSDAVSSTTSDEPTLIYHPSISVNSERWTGISRVQIDARNAVAISKLIDAALVELPRDGNTSVAQARTLLLAAKALTEAPDPPSEVIWELIQRAGAVVGLFDIFIKIFVGLTH